MCGPPALALAAAGLAAAGTMASGISEANGLRYQAKVADRNATLENQQTLDAIQRGRTERVQLDRRYSALQGQQQAAMAANGIDLGFGSAADVVRDTTMLRNEDALALYKNQDTEIRGHDINASNYVGEGRAKRSAAKGAIVSAAFSAGSTLLGGAQQYTKLKNPKQYGSN
ncbi:hypothetical protein [Sphingomonas sp.]|uniref:hypothetical protein n=1 Tax=Sphingomonas sp. TaxID=28214 RepID=UPI0035C7B938